MVDILSFWILVGRLLGKEKNWISGGYLEFILLFLGYILSEFKLQLKSLGIIRLKLLKLLWIFRRMRLRSLRVFFLLLSAFMGKIKVNYNFLFILLWSWLNNYNIFMESKINDIFFIYRLQWIGVILVSCPFDLVLCQREALFIL
jgi:hypothetical protein